jgi:aromatic-L-amino-acid decarboxylase
MPDSELPDLQAQADDFVHYGERAVHWIAEYLRDPERYPVLSQVRPGEIKAQFPTHPPAAPESMDAILADFDTLLMPGMTHWNHPGFMAYFANSSPAPGVIAEMLSAALNQNAMLWRTSPAATELEEVMIGWLAHMLGLPDGLLGLITDTASISSLLAICAAREAIPGLNIRQEGLSGRPDVPRLRLYCSEQAHSSIERAAMTLGIGQQGVRKIATDAEFRLDVDALRQALIEDKSAGWLPFCVVATVGTTSTTAIDPVAEIAGVCRQEGIWLHVDAAYGGAAALVPEFRHVLAGCELADSLVINPHKWLFTPMDCSVLFARDMNALRRAFSLVPDYLMTEGAVTNFMDYGVQLGRRFRALKLWMIIRAFGTDALAVMIREHIRLAQMFAGWIDAAPDWERLAPAPLSAVCFRAHPSGMEDETALESLNARLMDAVNATGEIFLSHTKLNGRYTLRLAIGNMHTQEKHVARAWQLLQSCQAERSVYKNEMSGE